MSFRYELACKGHSTEMQFWAPSISRERLMLETSSFLTQIGHCGINDIMQN